MNMDTHVGTLLDFKKVFCFAITKILSYETLIGFPRLNIKKQQLFGSQPNTSVA